MEVVVNLEQSRARDLGKGPLPVHTWSAALSCVVYKSILNVHCSSSF